MSLLIGGSAGGWLNRGCGGGNADVAFGAEALLGGSCESIEDSCCCEMTDVSDKNSSSLIRH